MNRSAANKKAVMTVRCASRLEQAREGRSAGSRWLLLLALPLQMLAGSSQGAETAAVPRSSPQELDLAYEIYAGGLHAFSADAAVERTAGTERFSRTNGQSLGFFNFPAAVNAARRTS